MCGIAGIVTWGRPGWTPEVMDAMLHAMVHRGPDHQRHRLVGGADLGACRLAIQDLSPAGNQPQINEDGTVAVVFNGEIYNAGDLRAPLVAAGHRFTGHSDTEVLVHGYEQWGIDGLQERCDGMWAFALWDATRRVAYLSRDRCGEKPLYYRRAADGALWFGSTLAALFGAQDAMPAYRPAIVLEYLACGYVPADSCIFEGVDKLAPGCYLETREGRATVRRYWSLRYAEREEAIDTLEEQLDARLDRAVKQCLVSDVPLGAFLSGGIDSSLIVAMMARHQHHPRTFTMRVPGTDRDEGEYARAVAQRYGTEHVEIPLGSECVEALPDAAMHLGEPFADSSCIPAYFVAREIRRHVTVVLGGDGGDEGFGGYRGVPYLEQLEWMHRRGAAGLRRAAPRMIGWADGHTGWVARGLRAAAYASDFRMYLRNLCLLGPSQAAALVGPALRDATFEAWCRPFAESPEESSMPHWYQRGLAAGRRGMLAGDFLVKIDTMTMAHSVEARSPFLARDVLELAARLPAWAIADRRGDKVLLKRLARRLLPVECVDRPKAGFSVPLDAWIAGPWRRLARELLQDSLAVRDGLIDAAGLHRLLRRDALFAYRWESIVFCVLMLELWLRLVATRTDSVAAMRAAIAQPETSRRPAAGGSPADNLAKKARAGAVGQVSA